MVTKLYEDYLTRHGAKDTRHSGRSLYDHLKSTHDMLVDWGCPEHVCLGGLFHSVYGTAVFKHQSIDFKERPTVKALIGPKAEYLAYLFCVIDRPKVFLDGQQSPFNRHLWDRHNHQLVTVSHEICSALKEIEAANLLEQGTNRNTLERLIQMGISEAARAAVEARLG